MTCQYFIVSRFIISESYSLLLVIRCNGITILSHTFNVLFKHTFNVLFKHTFNVLFKVYVLKYVNINLLF